MSDQDKPLIYLYTSNIRERYVADAISAAAQPSGTSLRFRYDRRHVADKLEQDWDSVVGRLALIVFSIQHSRRFHPAAFIPIRLARITSTTRRGDTLVVDLSLESYLSLAPSRPSDERSLLGRRVSSFSNAIRGEVVHAENPDDESTSAGYGASVAQLRSHLSVDGIWLIDNEDDAFRAIVEYLSASLTDPEWFYYRVVGVRRVDGKRKRISPKSGTFNLRTGGRYEITVAQIQTGPAMLPADILVKPGEGVSVHDVGRLELRSVYDIYSVPLDVEHSPAVRRSYVDFQPVAGVRGPSVRLDLTLRPSTAQTWALPAAGAAGAAAVTVAASDLIDPGWQLTVGIAATVGLFLAGIWQTKRGLSLF